MQGVLLPRFQTGDRVRVRRRLSNAWATEPYGTVVSCWDETEPLPVERRTYWVMFYEPQFSEDGSRQYGSSSVSEEDLEPA